MARRMWFLALALFSLLDLALSLTMFQIGPYEANPVGAFILRRYGAAGLVWFKLAHLGLAFVVLEVIAHWRPRTALWLSRLGWAFYLAFVIYEVHALLGIARG